MHTQPKQLPTELIFKIIADVAPDDIDSTNEHVRFRSNTAHEVFRTLAAASMVCSTWNTICRPHIFHTLFISSKNPSARLSFLHFEAPHLNKYIRKVWLWWAGHGSSTAPAWFSECFSRLHNLHELHLEGMLGLWALPVSLAEGILSMLAAPRLRKLTLRSWNFEANISDLVNILPASLEELTLDDIITTDGHTDPPFNVYLERLRSLELLDVYHPMMKSMNFIMCPNLQRFAARWTPYYANHCGSPVLIPNPSHSLSELALEVSAGGELLNFGTAIQPSVVTIDVDGKTSYLDLFNLSQDCIRRLPFPYSIQVLTINVLKTHFGEEGFYPMASEYEVLSRSLHELYENGSLEDTVLNVKMEVGPIDVDLRIDEDRELDKVEVAFEAMFKANVLEVAFLRVRETQWTSELEPVTRISKRRV